jgi:AcrR family transcriptional regulator
MSETLTKKTKLRRDERRDAIICGAAEAFVENGYEATSLEDVAEAAGISRALLYRHFDTKQAIYRAVLDNFLIKFHSLVARPREDRVNERTLDGLIEAAKTDPNGFRLFFRHAVREPDFKSYYEDIAKKRNYFIQKQLEGSIKDPKERKFIAYLLQELIISTILIWIENGMPNPGAMPKLLNDISQSVIQERSK